MSSDFECFQPYCKWCGQYTWRQSEFCCDEHEEKYLEFLQKYRVKEASS